MSDKGLKNGGITDGGDAEPDDRFYVLRDASGTPVDRYVEGSKLRTAMGLGAATGDMVTVSATQTLANKTMESPILTGTPTAPTPAVTSSDTTVATTAFVSSLLTASITSAGGTLFATRSGLFADLAYGEGAQAWVYADTTLDYNGIYRKSGASGSGSWSKVLDLPYRAAPATFSGSVVTLVATLTTAEVGAADLIYGVASTFPRGTTTLTLAGTGTPLPFRHASGRELDFGDWATGDFLLIANLGTEFRLLSPSDRRDVAPIQSVLSNEPLPERIAWPYQYAIVGSGSTGHSVAVPAKDDVLHLIPVWGQSLALGATSGPIVASTPLYRGRALQPRAAMRLTSAQRIGQLVDAYEQQSASVYDTIASSMMWHTLDKLDTAVSGNSMRFASFVTAVGSTYYYDLKRGSVTYQRLLYGIEDIVAIADRSGISVVVPGICVLHGENDTAATTRAGYAGMLRQFQRNLDEDIRRITRQTAPVMIFTYQTNRVVSGDGVNQRITMAQLDAGSDPLIRLVGPHYNMPAADVSHKTAAGTNRQGQMFARAIYAELFGTGWQPLRARSVFLVSSTVIQIDCDVPVSPLVLDTSGDVDPTGLPTGNNYGFDVRDSNANFLTISTVAVHNDTSIRLTLSSALSSASQTWIDVAYAMRKNDSDPATQDGPVTGARGCIRDSEAHASLVESYDAANWLCAFVERVPVTV